MNTFQDTALREAAEHFAMCFTTLEPRDLVKLLQYTANELALRQRPMMAAEMSQMAWRIEKKS